MVRGCRSAGLAARIAGLICLLVGLHGEAAAIASATVLAAPEAIPQSYTVNGEQTGFLIDIVREAFRRAGRPLEIRLLPWARCLSETRHGNIDGFFTAFMTPERQSYFDFSAEPLMIQTESLFVLKGAPITFEGDLSKLANLRVGLVYETAYGARLDRFLVERPAPLDEEHASLEVLIKMLAGRRIDLLPGDRQSVIQTLAALGLSNQIVELSPIIETVPSYLAYTRQRDLRPIIDDIDKSLRTMKEDGFYDRKFHQYYPQ